MAYPRNLRWSALREQYCEFVIEHNRQPRRPSADREENSLSEWAHEQRRMYRGQRQQPLRADRRRALEEIPGWTWEPRRGPQPANDRWESHRLAVVDFYHTNGRYPRLTASAAAERKLAGWVKNQLERLPGRTDDIGIGRRERIRTTPGWPRPRATAWAQTADELDKFVRETGRLPRRSSTKRSDTAPTAESVAAAQAAESAQDHERMLSMWCANQRRFEHSATAANPYPRDRRDRLESIPGWRWSASRKGATPRPPG